MNWQNVLELFVEALTVAGAVMLMNFPDPRVYLLGFVVGCGASYRLITRGGNNND